MSKWGWLFVASLLLLPQPAFAAVGLADDTRPPAPQQRRAWKNFGVSTQLTGNFLQGNANLTTFGSSLDFNANAGPHQFFANAGNFYNHAGTEVNRISGSAMYAYGVRDNLNFYGYTTHSHDSAIQLDYRLTAGGGVCFHKLFAPAFSSFLVSLGPASEWEWLHTGAQHNTWRSVVRLQAMRPLAENLELGVDSFYAPALGDWGDARIYGEGSLKVGLTEALSWKLTAADEYHSRRPLGLKANDFGFFTSLVAEWGK